MGSGFDDWIYCHFFTITVNYNSSHIELLNICLKNLYEESLTNLGLISTTRIHEYLPRSLDTSHHVEQFLCSSVLSRE
jgi:hypothetical protein